MKKIIQNFIKTQLNSYELKHKIKEDDDFFYVTVKIKMNKSNSKNEKIINKCFEEQVSPVTQLLVPDERQLKSDLARGESVIPLYQREP